MALREDNTLVALGTLIMPISLIAFVFVLAQGGNNLLDTLHKERAFIMQEIQEGNESALKMAEEWNLYVDDVNCKKYNPWINVLQPLYYTHLEKIELSVYKDVIS